MRIIPAAECGLRLRECAVTNRATDKEGFIETGNVLPAVDIRAGRNHDRDIFISVAAAKEMARLVGWYPPDEVEEVQSMLAAYAEKVSGLEAYVEKLERFKALETELQEV